MLFNLMKSILVIIAMNPYQRKFYKISFLNHQKIVELKDNMMGKSSEGIQLMQWMKGKLFNLRTPHFQVDAYSWANMLHMQLVPCTVSKRKRYCKSGNFRENSIFANSVKRHICVVKIGTRAWCTYISKRVILLFCQDSIFTNFPICEVSQK